MSRDPIPTFRRLGRRIVDQASQMKRATTTRAFWVRLVRFLSAVVAVGVVGFVGSLLSYPVCKRSTQDLIRKFPFGPSVQWADDSRMVPVPFPEHLRPGNYPDTGENPILRKVFAPSRSYVLPGEEARPEEPGEEYWGFVRCTCPFPFVIRAHFGAGYSIRRLEEDRIRGGGTYLLGVRTYVGAFGLVIPINTWGAGGSFHR